MSSVCSEKFRDIIRYANRFFIKPSYLMPQPATISRRTSGDPGKDRQFVTSLARGLEILQCFSSEMPELTRSDLVRMTGLPQPTVWRLCHTLLELDILTLTSGERMRPGLGVLRLGHSALAGLDVVELARPYLQDMADHYRAACGLATRQGVQMVMIERCHGQNPLLTSLRRGSAFSIANSGLGWAYLAGSPMQERDAIIAKLDSEQPQLWKKNRKSFQIALAEFRRVGFIVNSGSFHPDYHTVAVPVLTRRGKFH